MKFWIKELTRLKVLFLFIVPNAGHKYKGDLISFDKVNFKNLLESNGYELILKRAKYLDPYVQKYGLNPTIYYLFKNFLALLSIFLPVLSLLISVVATAI